jgi:hydroxymethylglutaryl-CoA lyase
MNARIHAMSGEPIEIVEVGPRDGLQSEAQVLPTATKVEFIQRLVKSGLSRVEVASFVNPKRVPQMADAEEVLSALAAAQTRGRFIGLVLNRRGFERARAAGCGEVGMAIAASESFSQRNQGCSVEEGIGAWLDIARLAHEAGIRAQLTISTAFGCPFEGEVPVERVIDLARQVAAGSPDEIAVADTIGVAVPTQVSALIAGLHAALPQVRLRAHFHNTRNTGLANAYAATQAGVRALDASCGGIGGCPFAPAATGNIPTEDLIYMLHRMGFETGVDLSALLDTSRWLQTTLDHAVPGMLVKAGPFPQSPAIQRISKP